MLKNMLEPDGPQMTIWRMRIACWITKATDTHSEYVIFIGFVRQQWSHAGASMLRFAHIARPVFFLFDLVYYCNKMPWPTLKQLNKYLIFGAKLLILSVYSIHIFCNYQLKANFTLLNFASKKKSV
jgi:hypothetical protein